LNCLACPCCSAQCGTAGDVEEQGKKKEKGDAGLADTGMGDRESASAKRNVSVLEEPEPGPQAGGSANVRGRKRRATSAAALCGASRLQVSYQPGRCVRD